MLYRQIPPNIQPNWIKRFYIAKQKQYSLEKIKCRITRIDFVTGGQEINISILVEFSSYFFAFITFDHFFFLFQDNKANLKQAPGHNHENTIFRIKM